MGSTSFVSGELTRVSFFVRWWFRRRNVDFGVIRTAASGDESFVGAGRGGFEFRRRSDENWQGLSRTVFGRCRTVISVTCLLSCCLYTACSRRCN